MQMIVRFDVNDNLFDARSVYYCMNAELEDVECAVSVCVRSSDVRWLMVNVNALQKTCIVSL